MDLILEWLTKVLAFLKTKKIESIRYINGDDASYLYTTKKETSYFMNIFSKF